MGWVDNQLTQRVDPSAPGLNLDYAMARDSIMITAGGSLNGMTDSLYFRLEHGNMSGGWSNNLFFNHLADTLFFRDVETSSWYICPDPGPVITNGALSSYVLNISNLTLPGGCLNGISLSDGDSLVYRIHGEVRNISRKYIQCSGE